MSFRRDVLPILEQHCFACHGPEKQKAGLRLDTRAGLFAESRFEGARIVEVGRSHASELYRRAASSDEDERMPPKGDALAAHELELLRRWIDDGADVPEDGASEAQGAAKHWAYVAPKRPPLPSLADASRARNPIDHFVQERLAREGLAPAEPAARETLLRRASLDLTGLPPTLEELDRFLADAAPDAYERAVDALLASPAYAEHQTRAWLDLARYADTNGYEKDGGRPSWRWRDWVLEAFRNDMPFDRFTIEQLAGDLLPNATLSQRIATGFHRNTMVNREGGIDPEEYRVAAVVDRVNTTAEVWLGSTLACAQCHNHKYDPFSQREYFQLYAFFDHTADTGNELDPSVEAPTAELERALPELRAETKRVRDVLATWTPELEREYLSWTDAARAELPAWKVLAPVAVETKLGGRAERLADDSLLFVGEPPAEDVYSVTVEAPAAGARAFRIEVLKDASLPKQGPGRDVHRNFVLSELRAFVPAPASAHDARPRPLRFRAAWADHHQTGSPDWPAAAAIDGDRQTGWAIAGGHGRSHQIVLALDEPLAADEARSITFELDQAFGARHLIGRLRISASTEALPEEPIVLPPEEERALARGPLRTAVEERELHDAFLARAPSLAPMRAKLAELELAARPPRALVMQERATPRDTCIHVRGSFTSQGERVEPGVPAVLSALPADAPRNRLGLARWLVARENPLTARVTVNREWQRIFGRGLVATSEDFGTQGELPSHPELLDWLAVELMESGWSLRRLHRLIVTSETYRQGSTLTPELLERDPENVLLARAPRLRLEAEVLRDLALRASGLLSADFGGRSVFPPQPTGIWNVAYSDSSWETARDESRWRRGIYTFWRRTAPYPTFVLFDAPSRELCSTRRPRTNTPLQALALLNDPAFVEAAGALARLMMGGSGAADEERIALGFRSCTARAPDEEERAILLALLAAERSHFAAAPQDAQRLAEGEGLLPVADLDPVELAAWTVVANALLNLDETITKG